MLKRKRGQLPWYMSLKIEKPQCWHSLHSREDFPVSSPHSSLHSYIFVYSSQMSSNLRFTESLLKCVYVLHKRVCLEQNGYTIFEETCNDVNGGSLLEWLPAGVYLKFWCIMKWAGSQAIWSSFPLVRRFTLKDVEMILQEKLRLLRSTYSHSPKYVKMWCELNHP